MPVRRHARKDERAVRAVASAVALRSTLGSRQGPECERAGVAPVRPLRAAFGAVCAERPLLCGRSRSGA